VVHITHLKIDINLMYTENTKMPGNQKECQNVNNDLISKVLQRYTIQEIADKLSLANGTVKRWIDRNNVPTLYHFDLMKLVGCKIDYSKYSPKEKDQFFTQLPTAKHCYEVFCGIIELFGEDEKQMNYIEPSAGSGTFLQVLPSGRTIGIDIEPRHERVIKGDFLSWKPNDLQKTYVVFGNPPFGLRGNLALRFINHSFQFAEYVCFILPQLFESDGKGVPRKRVKGYNLVHSEKLDACFNGPDNSNPIAINVIFQVWSKNHTNKIYALNDNTNDTLKIYSLSDGDSPSKIRNKNMIHKCDVYLPSTCFGQENMKCYESFDDLPGRRGYGIVFLKDREINIAKCKRIDWASVSFLSTNSALNLRTSVITSKMLHPL
jgi:hypothetical protein